MYLYSNIYADICEGINISRHPQSVRDHAIGDGRPGSTEAQTKHWSQTTATETYKTLEPNKTLGGSDALEALFTGASPLPGYTGAAPDSVVTRISIGISISII